MKKITFGFFMLIFPFLTFAQINEGFEGATFPPNTPGNWAVLDNGIGTAVSWAETTNAAQVHSGLKAAIIDRENIGQNFTSEDWLVTPKFTVPVNGQLRFFTRQTLIGNNGATFEMRISTNASQTNQAAYTVIPGASWTEATLNTTYNVYEEKLVNFPASFSGQQVYVAFVRTNLQLGTSTSGDRWLVDDVKVVQRCLDPTLLNVGTITTTTANVLWTNNGTATQWEVEVLPDANIPTGVGVVTSNNPYLATGLLPGTDYKFYVRALCGTGDYSVWVGPYIFVTKPAGTNCAAPITVTTLPYSTSNDTGLFSDIFDVAQGAGCAGGTTNYVQGNDVFYSYTADFTGNLAITMTSTANNSSIFVYSSCANVGVSCLAGVANATNTPRNITSFPVVNGQTYYILISSSATTQTVPYSLIIQKENCLAPSGLTTTNIGTTTASFSWTNPSTATAWEVAIQPVGSPIPTGAGTPATTNTNYAATGLTAATAYQYWVRADCGGGLFSAWSGPFLFTTGICDAAQKCTYIFRVSDTFGDGWNGNTMTVRQNGVVVATITGPTAAQGTTPVDVPIALCQNFPLELFWEAGGSFAGEVAISIINNFNQTIYTRPTSASQNSSLYTASFDCATPLCFPPTNLTAGTLTTTGATLGWTAPGTNAWQVYIVANGGAAPTATTVGTAVTTNPYVATGLIQNTAYQYYVRVVCNATSNSTWAGPFSFTTLPTCPAPLSLVVTATTLTSATVGWTNTGTATTWEVFSQAPGAGVPTGAGTIVTTNPYTINGLTAATNYEFYVRAVCSPTDSSNWSGPKTFNTLICLPANQCNYKFTMTNTASTGWHGNTMTIRQNGVIVRTIGSTFTTGTTLNISIPLCAGIPFEVFWNSGGTLPAQVGISVTTPFLDVVFNKPAGQGTQNTLLYTGIGDCSPPTCGKPITLGANTITQTTAILTWAQPATPGTASSWEIVVQPAILNAPTGAGTPATSPYTATGLNPGSTYEFYVRTLCTGTAGFSTWAGPFEFNTRIINDECSAAIVASVNSNASCALTTSGSVVGATGSLPTTTCAGANDDVWFQFTATSIKHYINMKNIVGSTTALSYAIYSGTCGSLTQVGPCYTTNNNIIPNLTVGTTYYLRVFTTTTANNQTTTFDICIGTVSTCSTAAAFCSNPVVPFIFPNTVGVPSEGNQSCLTTNPNPTYYFMTILQPGIMSWEISQNTSYDATGNQSGTGLDVDFICWGPFASNSAACGNLTLANQVGCSYSAAAVENFTFSNNPTVAGQVYVFLITNFNGLPGFIKIKQTNEGAPTAGVSNCAVVCSVNLGPDQNVCGVAVPLDSGLNNPAATFVWKRNGVIIAGATASTYTATQSGTYRVEGSCGPNTVSDDVIINIGPNLISPTLPDYTVCDDITNDGLATFNLASLTPGIIAGLNPNFTYTVTYHYNSANALANTAPINAAVPFTGASQTLYIRVQTVGSAQCNTIIVQNLVVNPLPTATIASSAVGNVICSNQTATITVTPSNFISTNATYVWTLNGAPFAGTTNVITPNATGTYEVTISLNGCTKTLSLPFTINPLPTETIASSVIGDVICSNQTATITVTPTNFVSTAATYSWTLNGVAIVGTSDTITPTATGTYEATVLLNGCSSKVSLLFTINPLPAATIASSAAGNVICSNQTATITVTPTNFTSSSATYVWTLNGAPFAGTTNVITPNATGTYGVTITLNGCTKTLSLPFTINTLPVLTLTGTNLVKCLNETAILTVVPTNYNPATLSGLVYTWKLNNNTIPNLTTSTVSITDFGIYTVIVTNAGCSSVPQQIIVSEDTTDIPISVTGACEATPNGTNFLLKATAINGSFNESTTLYQWQLEGVNIPAATMPIYDVTLNSNNVSFPANYSVKITTVPDGCYDTQKFVVNNPLCVIQKGISPNGDGDNDFFDLRGRNVTKLSIYNRYGAVVYSLENYTNQWNGQSKAGDLIPVGTYYYEFEQKDGEIKTGWIYLNR